MYMSSHTYRDRYVFICVYTYVSFIYDYNQKFSFK